MKFFSNPTQKSKAKPRSLSTISKAWCTFMSINNNVQMGIILILLMINIRFRKVTLFENRHTAGKWWTHYFNLLLYELSSHNRTTVSSSWSNLVQWRLKWVGWFKCWSSLNSSLLHMAFSRWLEAQENDLWQSVFLSPHQCQYMYCFPIIPPDSKRTAFCRHKLSLLYNSMRKLSSKF